MLVSDVADPESFGVGLQLLHPRLGNGALDAGVSLLKLRLHVPLQPAIGARHSALSQPLRPRLVEPGRQGTGREPARFRLRH